MILNLNSKVLIIFFGFSFLACSDDAATAYQVSGKVTSENKNNLKKVVKKVASLSPQDRDSHKKEALAFVVSHKSWLQNAAKYKEIYTSLSR